MTATAAPVEFDPFSNEFFDDPTEVYRRLRDERSVYFNEHYGFYALSRFADVLSAHRDWQAFSSIIMMDPPAHDRLRALVCRVFTPRAISALEPMVREVICSFLDPLDGAHQFSLRRVNMANVAGYSNVPVRTA